MFLGFSACSSVSHGQGIILPPRAEDDARVQYRQRNARNTDHGTLQDHEGNFFIGEVAVEASLKLGHAEAGADIDGEGS